MVVIVVMVGVIMEGINEKVLEFGVGVGEMVWVFVIVVIFDMIVRMVIVEFMNVLEVIVLIVDEGLDGKKNLQVSIMWEKQEKYCSILLVV